MSKEHDIEIALSIVSAASPEQRIELLQWATELQQIRNADLSRKEKVVHSVKATVSRKIIFPIIKSLSKNVKEVGKSTRERIGHPCFGTPRKREAARACF